jgi:hypothetical protein
MDHLAGSRRSARMNQSIGRQRRQAVRFSVLDRLALPLRYYSDVPALPCVGRRYH